MSWYFVQNKVRDLYTWRLEKAFTNPITNIIQVIQVFQTTLVVFYTTFVFRRSCVLIFLIPQIARFNCWSYKDEPCGCFIDPLPHTHIKMSESVWCFLTWQSHSSYDFGIIRIWQLDRLFKKLQLSTETVSNLICREETNQWDWDWRKALKCEHGHFSCPETWNLLGHFASYTALLTGVLSEVRCFSDP